MSRVVFCRSVRFTADHFYKAADLSDQENLDLFGQSTRVHPHHWRLTVWLEGSLNEHGMMVDLTEVDNILNSVAVDVFHGKCMNQEDVYFQTHQPTNEVLAGYFADKLLGLLPATLIRLRIAETDDLYAEWLP